MSGYEDEEVEGLDHLGPAGAAVLGTLRALMDLCVTSYVDDQVVLDAVKALVKRAEMSGRPRLTFAAMLAAVLFELKRQSAL